MHYVMIRDDDANAFTDAAFLEWLYAPFVERGMPVHLAVVPEVDPTVLGPDGDREGFLPSALPSSVLNVTPVAQNDALCRLVADEELYVVLQHGLHHAYVNGGYEFDHDDTQDLRARVIRGHKLLIAAGLGEPAGFVAPQDKVSKSGLKILCENFKVVSSGWYALRRLPKRMRAHYLVQCRLQRKEHWTFRGTSLLSHPGCILSYTRDAQSILPELKRQILSRSLTVVVSHHWEYVRGGTQNRPMIQALHDLAPWLESRKDIQVIRASQAHEWIQSRA